MELSEKMSKKELNEKRKLREKLKRLKLQREMSLGAFDAEQHDPELFALSGKDILDEEDKVIVFLVSLFFDFFYCDLIYDFDFMYCSLCLSRI